MLDFGCNNVIYMMQTSNRALGAFINEDSHSCGSSSLFSHLLYLK